MECLSEESIIKIICDYIDNDVYNYAILIDGEWGCGKTFFIKEKLIDAIVDHEKINESGDCKSKIPLYISLYSVKSDIDISYQIYLQMLPFIKGETKVSKIANIGLKILSDIAKNKGISDQSISDSLGQLVKLDNYILIFDDLERCNMSINEVLGYINNFVEHDGVKAIIVANQNEIGRLNAQSNLELKYLLSTKDNILYNKSNENNIHGKSQQQSQPVMLTLNDIKDRTEYLFGENLLYNHIKEKLIGKTIYFKPDICNVITKITEKHIKEDRLKESILDNKEYIRDFLNDQNHNNLRTLQFVFNAFQAIGNFIIDSEIECKSDVLTDLLQYCLFVAVKYKKGEKTYKWEENCEFGQVPLTDDIYCFKYILGFKFVDDFIINSNINKDKILNIVKKYIDEKQKKAKYPEDPLYQLSNWWELEDKDIYEKIEIVQEKIRNEIYTVSIYPKVILTLINIVEMGFNETILSETLRLMEKIISKSQITDEEEFDSSSLFISNPKILNKYNSSINSLKKLLKASKENTKYNKINDLFNDCLW